MSTNKYKPHIFVLPEDDANRQIANGFVLDPNLNSRAIQILLPVGGWNKVVDEFRHVHASEMHIYSDRMMVLLVDFDNDQQKRLTDIKKEIPPTLVDRVFILGVLSEPEKLRIEINMTLEGIGKALSKDCADKTQIVWSHDLLRHNETELLRMISSVKPFLFNCSA